MKPPLLKTFQRWQLWKNGWLVRFFVISIVLLLVGLGALVWWTRTQLPPEIPLYYSMATGRDQLAHSSDITWLSGMMAGIVILNIVLASYVSQEYSLLRNFLLTMSGLCLLLWGISLIQITWLVR